MNANISAPTLSVNKGLQKDYDEQYQQHDAYWRTLGAKYKVENILKVCQGKTFHKVLEVGCGDGSILAGLNPTTFANELHGIDISESGIQRTKERNLSKLQSAQIFNGYQIPYADKSFDLLILSHVLEHVEFERTLLREIQRVSKYQIIEVPRDYRFNVDKKLQHFLNYGHINIYTPSGLRFLLLSEKFTILNDRKTFIPKEVIQYLYNHHSFVKRQIKTLETIVKSWIFNLGTRRIKEYYTQAYTVFCESKN